MDSIVGLIDALADREDPVLTWYGSDSERVDFSGRTLTNWVIKATNLLTEELGVAPGEEIWLDLPSHWRALVWALATWNAGARTSFTPSGATAAITAEPGPAHDSLELIVIALPALARSVPDLPAGAIDGAADLMTQADVFLLPPAGRADHDTGLGLTQRELLSDLPPLVPTGPEPAPGQSPRVFLPTDPLPQALTTCPALWAAGAGLVIAPDPGVMAAEGVTHTLG